MAKNDFWQRVLHPTDVIQYPDRVTGFQVPGGDLIDRPNSAPVGTLRRNDTDGTVELFQAGSWYPVPTTYLSGETNAGVNIGAGHGIYAGKSGTDLQFKTLVPGSNVAITPVGNTLVIESGVDAVSPFFNIGSGTGNVYSGLVGTNQQFRTLTSNSGELDISTVGDEVEFTLTLPPVGETNTITSVGSGSDVYKTKIGADFQLRSLISTDSVINLNETLNEIEFSIDPNPVFSGSSHIGIPFGVNGARPVLPITGYTRFSLTDVGLEYYDGADWRKVLSEQNATATYLPLTGGTITGDLTVTNSDIIMSDTYTVDGRDVSVDGTKLDTIETGATADQNASEVPFTPAGNLISTDVQNALEELDTEKLSLTGGTMTGDIVTSGLVDGRDVSDDGAVLDNINATGETGFVVRTADPNSFARRSITGTSNEIVVTNGDGVSGDTNVAFATNPIFSGTGAIGLPIGTTTQRPSPVEGHVRINNETGTLEFYVNGSWVSSNTGGSGSSEPFLESPSGISGHQLTSTISEDVYSNQTSETQLVTSIMVSNTNELNEALVDVSLVRGSWVDNAPIIPSFSFTPFLSNPTGVFFKDDGTKFYVISNNTSSIYQYTLSTPWDISTTSYDVVVFDVSSQDAAPEGLFFKDDGTKLYVIGDGTDSVHQYTLSTPWDISTTSYDSVSFDVSGQDTTPQGLFFKDDGTKLYIIGDDNDSVYQYTLSTPWDVSTSSYDSVSFSVNGQNNRPYDIFFDSDGTKMYMIGGTFSRRVYQYTLSTSWDISTASYDSVSIPLTGQGTGQNSTFFKPDGTKLYIIGSSSDSIHQSTLSTPWDISTASYDSIEFLLAGQETNPQGLFFKTDGTKLYIVGTGTGSAYQYTLSTPWDISTTSYDSVSFDVSSQETDPRGLFFKDDGTKLYVIGDGTDSVHQYTLSTPWDISTASYDSVSFSVSGQDASPSGLFFKNDGTKLYIVGSSSDSIYQYTLSTPWDISTASYDSVSFDVSSQETDPQGLFFKNDGTKLYIVGSSSDSIYQYTLSTPWDISTASYDSISFSVSSQDTTPQGLFFKTDGTKLYIIGNDNDSVYQYTLIYDWELVVNVGIYYDSVSFDVSSQETDPQGLFFKTDGTKLYIIGNDNDSVYQYTLSTPWDVSTASYDSVSFDVSSQETDPQGLFFKTDGTKLYIIGSSSDSIYQYTLSTPWDISTASYDSVSFDVSSQETIPTGLFFKIDGTKLYIIGSSSDSIYQYTLSTPWDISTASYDSVSFDVSSQVIDPQGLFFKNDGFKLYVIDWTNDAVYKYTLSTPWDISTASYDFVSFSVGSQETAPTGLFFKTDGAKLYIIGSINDSVYQYSVGTTIELSYQNTLDVSTATELLTGPIIIRENEVLRSSTDLTNDTYLTISYTPTTKSYYTKGISLDNTSVSTVLVGSINGDVVNSIRIVNDDPAPFDANTPGQIDVWWEDENGIKTYFVTNFDVFPGMSVDILDKNKFLPYNTSLKIQAKETGRLNVIVTGIEK